MRRGAKPAKAKAEAKLPVARKSLKSEGSKVRDLEKRLAEALTARGGGASSSRPRPARSSALSRARRRTCSPCSTRSCESAVPAVRRASYAVYSLRRRVMHLAPSRPQSPTVPWTPSASFPRPGARLVAGRAILDAGVVHVEDVLARTDGVRRETIASELGCSEPCSRAAAPRGQRPSARSCHPTSEARPVHGRADRAAPDLRRPGRDRHRERAAVHGAGGDATAS